MEVYHTVNGLMRIFSLRTNQHCFKISLMPKYEIESHIIYHHLNSNYEIKYLHPFIFRLNYNLKLHWRWQEVSLNGEPEQQYSAELLRKFSQYSLYNIILNIKISERKKILLLLFRKKISEYLLFHISNKAKVIISKYL